ncbi:MAG: hypothetical protein ABI977_25400 [Acidobacteriota bacterium]
MMSEDNQPKAVKPLPLISRVGIPAAVILAAFLIGFIPMWLKAREGAGKLARVESELQMARMENTLASAVIDARRGDYEQARQTASQFFASLRAESDLGSNSFLTQTQRERLHSLFTGRDDLITLLARGDPAAADRLSDLYVTYRELMKDRGNILERRS